MVDPFFRSGTASVEQRATFDMGLRAHMQRVFSYMAGGLVVTGILAWLVAYTALGAAIYGTPLKWVVILAPLGFVMFLNFRLTQMSAQTAQTIFWLFCGAMGLSMGALFMAYTMESIASTFFITAATFGGMALYGYTTKKDLSGFGSFLMMGVMGLFIASLINMFIGASSLQWVVSVLGVGIFTGLTAYDVQRIKSLYVESWGADANTKLAVIGALGLYLNFINAFQFLLSLMGNRR